jgi:hypothetical protein
LVRRDRVRAELTEESAVVGKDRYPLVAGVGDVDRVVGAEAYVLRLVQAAPVGRDQLASLVEDAQHVVVGAVGFAAARHDELPRVIDLPVHGSTGKGPSTKRFGNEELHVVVGGYDIVVEIRISVQLHGETVVTRGRFGIPELGAPADLVIAGLVKRKISSDRVDGHPLSREELVFDIRTNKARAPLDRVQREDKLGNISTYGIGGGERTQSRCGAGVVGNH